MNKKHIEGTGFNPFPHMPKAEGLKTGDRVRTRAPVDEAIVVDVDDEKARIRYRDTSVGLHHLSNLERIP